MASSSEILVLFRTRFPEYAALSDAVVTQYIDDAMLIYKHCVVGIQYLAAHLVTLDQESGVGDTGGEVDGGAGETTSESVGSVSASFKSQSEKEGDAFFTNTPYGRMFLALRKTSPGRAFTMRVY